MVELGPVHRLVQQGRAQGVQPAPAFVNQDIGVQVGWVVDLEEALGTAFLADQGTVAFGEAGRWQDQVCAVQGAGFLVVGNDHHFRCVQRGIDLGSIDTGVQVVFQHDDSIGLAVDHRLQGSIDRLAAEQG
ncbi:hypothetical protein D9M71_374170 [compost metagenome]